MNRISNHTDLLNYLADTFRLQSYLEVGVQYGNNFDSIKCKKRIGVDPDQIASSRVKKPIVEWNEYYWIHQLTSDQFFSPPSRGFTSYDGKFDLIFIDGDHTAQQVKRDFENSLKCLTDNGFIVIHDTNPSKEEHTHVPRDSKVWNGDVYKFACSLDSYSGILHATVDIDFGCTVVWRAKVDGVKNVNPVTTWQEFLQNKKHLNLVSVEEFKDIIHGNLLQLRTA